MSITYLGHSAFEIKIGDKKILIDPFLVKMPNYDCSDVTDIFVTHGHGDHLCSAIEISKKTVATITAVFELANYCATKGAQVNGINLGAWLDFGWGKVIAVPAFHSSSTPEGIYAGCPCGYVFDINGKVIYHAGDTCLNAEMKIIGEVYKPDIAMLPIGGYYTMDTEQAVLASEWLNSANIIPMHYNTFEAIKVDIQEFKRQIVEKNKKLIVLNIGEKFCF